MINKLEIKALKSISKLSLDCSKLNILIGTNSSGKSTVLQAILLFAQNIEILSGLNGRLISLGEFREVKNFNIDSNIIEIVLQNINEIKVIIDEFNAPRAERKKHRNLDESLEFLSFKLHYLSCNRIGSKDFYEKNYNWTDKFGFNGEYSIFYLMNNSKNELDSNLIKDMESYTLLHQVNYWLKYIIDANVSIDNIYGTDIVKASYSMIEGKQLRPKNIGSGISYIISILISCLGSDKDDIILIENPEIHLHPLAQSRLCEFLHFISQADRQLFIETHSDHIFNGIRAGIATEKIKNEDVSVYFFQLKNNCTEAIKVKFGKRGAIENQVDNLFDQFDIDLNKMLGL